MEFVIVFLFYVVQFVIGAIVYRRWMKQNSQLQTAKSQLFESVMSRYEDGTLSTYLEEIVDTKSPLLPSRRILRPSLICAGALILGVALMYVLIKFVFPGIHVVFRVIITFISVTPFVAVAFIGIAQEVDDIRIMNFARSIRDRLTQSMNENAEKNAVEDIIANAQKS
jgi:hypothetical protein